MAELARRATTDYPEGRTALAEAAAPTGYRQFRVIYSTEDWPVSSARTVTFTLYIQRGTRAEVAVWSGTILYQQATKRATTQTVGATIDGGVPDGSSLRFDMDGPPLRTSMLLEGD